MTDDRKIIPSSPSAIRHPSSGLRIALVTGASRGIGEAVARRLAKENMHVVAVARTQKALEKLDDAITAEGGTCTLVQLDLTEFSKIDQLALMIAERFGKLDVLVGNAAVLGEITPIPHGDPIEWHKTFDINLHANWHLIRTMDPLLKQSAAPRAIFVTSGVTLRTSPYWGAYTVSKAALESLVLTYASENEKTLLKINLLDPGRTRTRMRAQAFPGEDPDTLPTAESLTDLFVKLAAVDMMETGKRFKAY